LFKEPFPALVKGKTLIPRRGLPRKLQNISLIQSKTPSEFRSAILQIFSNASTSPDVV